MKEEKIPLKLSLGMKQRLAIASAMLNNPEVNSG
jgi:ABC-type multidrug transport system ATPase subunit